MIDAEEGITEQDKKIAGLAHEAGKGIIVVVNKWDLIKKDTHTMNRFEKRSARSSLSCRMLRFSLFLLRRDGV